jgi:hypothetical protein
LFDRRVLAYEEMLRLLSVWAERVHDAQRIMRFVGEVEPPEPPGREEWRNMQVRVRTIGSRPVGEAFARVVVAISTFFDQVTRVRNIREHGGGKVSEALEAMQEAGAEVQNRVAALELLVSSELEKL